MSLLTANSEKRRWGASKAGWYTSCSGYRDYLAMRTWWYCRACSDSCMVELDIVCQARRNCCSGWETLFKTICGEHEMLRTRRDRHTRF